MKIHNKLFLILFSFSLLLVTVLVLLIQWSIGKGMIEYVNSKEIDTLKPLIIKLESEYRKKNDWSTMKNRHKKFGDLLFSTLSESEFIFSPPNKERREPSRSVESENRRPHERPLRGKDKQSRSPKDRDYRAEFSKRLPGPKKRYPAPMGQTSYALLDNAEKIIVGHYAKALEYSKTPIIIDQVNVGWLVIPKRNQLADGYELDFIEQQQSYLWIIALMTMIVVALIALLLARHLAEPIKLIMRGMHKLTQGDYQQKVNLNRKDELGELSRDFNELAMTLDENENARKRWLANISHELRTPVAILRGELEAMLDGVRALNKTNVDSANDEVKHLSHLIDDLHQLTSADIGGMHYRKKDEELASWLNATVNKFRSYLADATILLEVDIKKVEANIFADNTRLCQLFENVINNCIKYAEASLVKVSLDIEGVFVIVTIEDNGVGVSEAHLPHLFEHLYRVENSRNRKTGGSGLGLSICAHIVAAHQGTICAEQSTLGGLAIIVTLPLSD